MSSLTPYTTSASPQIGVPYAPNIREWPYISATGDQIHFMFGSKVGFWGSSDRTALFTVRTNPRWRPPPSWIISNGHISTTANDLLIQRASRGHLCYSTAFLFFFLRSRPWLQSGWDRTYGTRTLFCRTLTGTLIPLNDENKLYYYSICVSYLQSSRKSAMTVSFIRKRKQ